MNNVPVPKRFATLVQDHLNANVDPLVFDGTAMIDPTGPTPAQEFVNRLSAYEAVGVKYVLLPVGMVLPSVQGAEMRRVFKSATTTILELPHPAPLFGSADAHCSVHARGETVVSVDCPRPSTITYRELYMPGWHANVDGRSLPVHDDGAFQSVVVPAGKSTVEFGYTPPHIALAVAALLLGLALLVAACTPWPRLQVPRRMWRTSSA
jgi:hypothetical protein